jgi:hypothetical protein
MAKARTATLTQFNLVGGQNSATQFDDVISAELPDPTQDPELFAVVTKNMIHGPCGHLNPNSPCTKDGKCAKKYQRKLIKETQTGSDGYPYVDSELQKMEASLRH